MSRAVGWVSSPSDITKAALQKADQSSFFILRTHGPTSFTLKDGSSVREQQADGNGGSSAKRVYKVTLGAIHSCSCIAFKRERTICKHICWVLLKRFRMAKSNPLIWQGGFVPREFDELLRGDHARKETKPVEQSGDSEQPSESGPTPGRALNADDVCPICQEELLEVRMPITWCRCCNNAAHIRCMKVWAEHQDTMQRGDGGDIQCPYCRQTFAPKEQLRREFTNTWERKKHKDVIHSGSVCADCSMTPIKGKLYIGIGDAVNLCGQCYRNGARPHVRFNVRERPGQSLKPAKRNLANHQLTLELQGREIQEEDYERLLELDRPASPDRPGVPDHVLNLLPCHKVGANQRLLKDGMQCRICLQAFDPAHYVKRLDSCSHYFHRDCIDTWCQNHTECPIDGKKIRLRQKKPRRTKTNIDILETRQRSAFAPRRPAAKLLERRRKSEANLISPNMSDLLVTTPIRVAGSSSQLPITDDIEEINPIPLINFRVRNMRL
ncbi:Oidioi.mRNA.OKI2018_I69.PAR.g12619.t1.cds [Oikopleura dioica]|uniref:Oidioi.mRNA.OKI2018_I69.PAR.g12619.t1.cds n=1 Tax=Oikopleura dioica TaxID=34765 RepID=A0ABN7S486_OIKDI|nr:Oidioi.mRNA.OKI2018_I69.PAR.g12619.t1.cds [Oikopleura dioica]